jgi:uncharacterized membrane protein YozB (DUF420 family)
MPVKWKIFFGLNLVLSLCSFICFILSAVEFVNSYRRDNENYIPLLMLFGLFLITFNGFLNIYVLQRFYPDKLVTSSVKTLYILSLIFNILVAIGLLILCIFAAGIEFSRDRPRELTSSGKIALYVIFVALLIDIVILIMQGQLPGIINRNNYRKIDSLIDSIGE